MRALKKDGKAGDALLIHLKYELKLKTSKVILLIFEDIEVREKP